MLIEIPGKPGRYAVPCHFLILLFGLFLLLFSASAARAQETPLSLSEALSRAMSSNPRLEVFDLRLQGLEGRRYTADQNPALEASVEIENFLGSDNLRGFDRGEYTLALSSVLELGGKRQARVGLVDSQYARVEAERRSETLDVLGQVAQRFVATLALQTKLELADEAVALAENTHDIVSRRADRGATPQAEVLRARAAVTRMQIEQSRLQAAFESRKIGLASLWGETSLNFQVLQGDLFQLGSADSFEALYERVKDSPAIQIYASEERIREADVQLARSHSESDIRWQVGVRRFEESNDTALVAGLSIPLFSGRRNRGEVRTALAARDEVQYRREDALLHLHSRLFDAYHVRQQSIDAMDRIRSQMLPDLRAALTQTREAYESGRYSYVEWAAAQQELLSAQRALVDAATTALLNQALIEQLTAQPLTAIQTVPTR